MYHDITSILSKKNEVAFNGNYMKYQRNRIRDLEKRLFICKVLFVIMMLIAILVVIFTLDFASYVSDLKTEIKSLQTVVAEKNVVIKEKESEIESLKEEIEVRKNTEASRLINSVKLLSGDVLDRAKAIVYLEATNQGEKGMQLVADTIFNRAESEKFKESTIAGVLKYQSQFSSINKIKTLTDENRRSEQYLMASQVIENKLLYGTTESDDVLFFMNPSIASRGGGDWLRTRKEVIQYKDHVFYE